MMPIYATEILWMKISVRDIGTGDETYVYQYDPETKQQSSVWLFQDQAPPSKFKRAQSTSKQMMAVFFSKSGHVASVLLLEQKQSLLSGTSAPACHKFLRHGANDDCEPVPGVYCSITTTPVPTLQQQHWTICKKITSTLSPIPHIHLTCPM